MPKDAYYFPHDFNAQHDPKIIALRRAHGWEGYGLFWAIVELLYEQGGRAKRDFDLLAFGLRSEAAMVRSVVESFDLFFDDGEYFGSYSVDRRIQDRRDRQEVSRRAGKASGKSRQRTIVERPLNDRSTNMRSELNHKGKERKGKESKEEERKETDLRGQGPEPIQSIQVQADPPKRTPVQVVVEAYKMAKGIEKKDKVWDKNNFSRASKPAKSLLDRFNGDPAPAVAYIITEGDSLSQKGYDWKLETIAKHAWDNMGVLSAEVQSGLQRPDGKVVEAMGADRLLGQRGPGGLTPAREAIPLELQAPLSGEARHDDDGADAD